MSISVIRVLLYVSALYDGLLGLAFFVAAKPIYQAAHITPPNHYGYVAFPALLLILFAVMFLRIAADPVARREQLCYCMGLKGAYAGVVFWYCLHGGVPSLWIPFAWADIAFLLLYFWAWRSLNTPSPQQPV